MDAPGDDEIEQLYRQVVSLGDKARQWFDGAGADWRAALPVEQQAQVAVESLGTTARLIGIMAWLLDPAQGPERRPAFGLSVDAESLPPGSVLRGTAGGEIVAATRRLVGAVAGLAAPVADGSEFWRT